MKTEKCWVIAFCYYQIRDRQDTELTIENVSGFRYVDDVYVSLDKAKEHAIEILKRHISDSTEGIELEKDISFEQLQELALDEKPLNYPNATVYWVCELDILERNLKR